MTYTDKATLQSYLGVTISSSLDTFLGIVIDGVSDYIEKTCGGKIFLRRKFENVDSDTTRYYDGNDAERLLIDDIRTITSVVADGVTLIENTDYFAYPLNEPVKEYIELIQPETRLNRNSRLDVSSPYVFTKAQRNVAITGKFGYSVTVPASVKLVATQLAGAVLKESVGNRDLSEVTSTSLGEYSVTYTKIADIANKVGADMLLSGFIRKAPSTPKTGFIKI